MRPPYLWGRRLIFVTPIPSGFGSIRRRTALHDKACLYYQREMSGAEAFRALGWLEPDSSAEARLLREKAMAVCDRLQNLATSDDYFLALQNLHTKALQALAEATGRAPRVMTNVEAEVSPGLAIAWRRVLVDSGVGQVEEVLADLVRRNRIRHPGFVPVEPI